MYICISGDCIQVWERLENLSVWLSCGIGVDHALYTGEPCDP